MQITKVMRMGARLLIERYLGWCPRAKAFATGDLSEDPPIPENRTGDHDAGTPWFIRPALILLLPLLPAFIFTTYTLLIPIILPSIELEAVVRTAMITIPVAVLIFYGRSTHDTAGATLAGALLFPLFEIYSQILALLLVPGSFMTAPVHWPKLFVATSPFILLLGAAGFLASRRSNLTIYIALVLGLVAVIIMLGIS
jgi:hypothetical protein